MAKKKQGVTIEAEYHEKDRWFAIAKTLLTLAPLVAAGYLHMFTGGGDISALLSDNPQITVIFLSGMTGPFTAYLIGLAQKHLYDGDAAYLMTHLALIFVAEALLRNVVYMVAITFLMYLVYQMTGVSPLASVRSKWRNHFFRDLSGCFVLIFFCSFCLFASMRIGM